MICRSYNHLIERLRAASASRMVEMETLGEFESGSRRYPMFILRMGEPGLEKAKVMIAAGIHGDEPAGVEAVLRFVEENANNDSLLSRFHFTIFPCNNPTGWERNTRENADGIDLNREFAAPNPAPEAAIIMRALRGRCFDLVFEMHEDVDAVGFYLYEISESATQDIGEAIVEAVRSMGYPVNHNHVIERRRAKSGLIRLRTIRYRKKRVPQAIYAYRTCGGHVLTLEPPASALPMEDRVRIELEGLRIALDHVLGHGAHVLRAFTAHASRRNSGMTYSWLSLPLS